MNGTADTLIAFCDGPDRTCAEKGRAFATFLKAALPTFGSWRSALRLWSVESPMHDADLINARMAFAGALPERVICVGVDAATRLMHLHKSVLLFDAPEQFTATFGAQPEASAYLAAVHALRYSTRCICLDEHSASFADNLGVEGPLNLTIPAIPPLVPREPVTPDAVLVFDHLGDPALLEAVRQSVAAAMPERTILLVEAAWDGLCGEEKTQAYGQSSSLLTRVSPYSNEAHRGEVHVHIGTERWPRLGERIIDSLASQRPVVVLLPAPGSARQAEARREPSIENEIDGLVVSSVRALTDALGLLRRDPFMGQLLARNAARRVQAVNRETMTAMAEALTTHH